MPAVGTNRLSQHNLDRLVKSGNRDSNSVGSTRHEKKLSEFQQLTVGSIGRCNALFLINQEGVTAIHLGAGMSRFSEYFFFQ